MKKSLLIILSVIFSLNLFAAEWTVMFYLNGDNNLDPFIKVTLDRLAKSSGSKDINVLVMVDIAQEGDSMLYAYRNGERKVLEENIEYDMGDPESMAHLIDTAREKLPAKRYALVVYTHGRGILNLPVPDATVFSDDNNIQNLVMSPDDGSSSILYEEEMVKRLQESLKGTKLDLLVFNSCLLGNTGIYLTLAPIAKEMVASEFLIGLDRNSSSVGSTNGIGIDLAAFVADLKEDPKQLTSKIAKNIVDRFYHGYVGGFFNPASFQKPRLISSTLAHYNLQADLKLKKVLRKLSDQFMQYTQDDPSYVDALYHELIQYRMVAGVGYYDLGSLAKVFKRAMNLPAADELISLLYESESVVVYSRSVHIDYDLSGLSIFFPITSLTDDETNQFIGFYKNLKFDKEIGWSRILKRFATDYPKRQYHVRLRLLKKYLAGEKVVVLPGVSTDLENEHELLSMILWERFYVDLEARNYRNMAEQVVLIFESEIESLEFINYKKSLRNMLEKAVLTDDDIRLKSMISMLEISLENI